MLKYELLAHQLVHEGILDRENFFQPTEMSGADLLKTHSREYVEKLDNLRLSRKEERAIGFPVREDLITRGKHIAQGTLECAYRAMETGVAMNIAGGTHHAFRDRGGGFCVFNDIALACNVLLDQKLVTQILIVDLDVHQGDGTASIFENDDRVFTFSMHGAKNYPLRKQNSDLDIGLPDGTSDESYLSILQFHLPRLVEEVNPDIVFYLSGVDVLQSDKLGRLNMSKEGCKQRDRIVFSALQYRNIPVAVSMGGGYSPKIADIVDAHANTFRVAQEMYF